MMLERLLLWATFKQFSQLSVTTFRESAPASINETQLLPTTLGPTWIAHNSVHSNIVLVVGQSELQTFYANVTHSSGANTGAGPGQTQTTATPHIDWALQSQLAPTNWSRIVHGSYSNDGQYVFAVDYDAGQVRSFGTDGAGGLSKQICSIQFHGKGAYAPVQGSPHPHEVYQHPHKPWVYVNDLGTDQIHLLSLAANGTLQLEQSFNAPPATGPRHSTFHPHRADVLYLIGEISSHVTTWTVNPTNGSLTLVGSVSALPPAVNTTTAGYDRPDGSRGMLGAEVVVKKDGSYLYAAERNQLNVTSDQLAIFHLSSSYPHAPIQDSIRFVPSGGLVPRGMALSPERNGHQRLAVGNQNSSSVSIFALQQDGGLELLANETLPSGDSPAGVLWM